MVPLFVLLSVSVSVPDPAWLRAKLEEVRAKHHLPSLGAALVWNGKVVAASAFGSGETPRRCGETTRSTWDR